MLGIAPRAAPPPGASFSGGNQQKLLLAKWLLNRPGVLLLHEPTQAVDVGAGMDILRAVRATAALGVCVVDLLDRDPGPGRGLRPGDRACATARSAAELTSRCPPRRSPRPPIRRRAALAGSADRWRGPRSSAAAVAAELEGPPSGLSGGAARPFMARFHQPGRRSFAAATRSSASGCCSRSSTRSSSRACSCRPAPSRRSSAPSRRSCSSGWRR